jgi:uncharacterized protein (TIGR03435 family)
MSKLIPGIALFVGVIYAQVPVGPAAHFDVASIKPNVSGANILSVRIAPGGRLRAVNATLKSLITSAYQVRDFEVKGGAGWIDSARFDVEAQGPLDPSTKLAEGDQIMLMLQALLAERFQLKLRREPVEMSVHRLVVAKGGAKLPAAVGGNCFEPSGALSGPPPVSGDGRTLLRPCGGFANAPDSMAGARVRMRQLAVNLSKYLGVTVVDETGLSGVYDVTLKFSPLPGLVMQDGFWQDAQMGASIFAALQEQLGLRLESGTRGLVEVLAIEGAARPSEN